jgi:two-component system, NtrC family, response regulator GlrR
MATRFVDVGIVGRSPAFIHTLGLMRRYARFDAPVLISGETGTGKELFARAIHYLGRRSGSPFIPVNCGALPDTLLEDELFGHIRGAFTDARGDRKGLISQAEGGTLFLDEIDALTPRAQVAVLRFLQERQYRPLGSEHQREADLRIVAATNADLSALIGAGGFRTDLMFRLDVATLRIPPLRERPDDLPLLIHHFLRHYADQYGRAVPALSPQVQADLAGHVWPGNVRELENAMHRAVILAVAGKVASLPLGTLAATGAPAAPAAAEPFRPGLGLKEARAREVEKFERRYLSWLLDQTQGNIAAAARRAGTERRNLGRIIKRLGVEAGDYRRKRRASDPIGQPSA